MQPAVVDVTEKVKSMYPFSGRKKICKPLLAWKSVKVVALVGLSKIPPVAVEVNVPAFSSTATVEVTALPDAARSGDT